jgi:hypothetical protein
MDQHTTLNDSFNEGVETAAKALDHYIIHSSKDKPLTEHHIGFNALVTEFQIRIRKEKKV